MIMKYDTECLNRLIKNIFDITGISISILDTEHHVLANFSRKYDFCSLLQTVKKEGALCQQCDNKILEKCLSAKKLEYHICRAGFYDSAMPIIKYDKIVGFVIMGRIRSESSPPLLEYMPDTDTHLLNQLNKLYQETPIMTKKQLEALYELLPSILFDKAIQIIYEPFINEVTEFINSNLKEDLSINMLCAKFHVSTDYLYKSFRNNLKSTVNEYIIAQRIKRAKEMLADSNDPVYMIAEKVGIRNYTYFCRLFKKRNGIPPAEYRKASRL